VEHRAPAHFAEDVEIEEVHPAEDEEHRADLGAEVFDHLLEACGLGAVFEGERHVADIDEIKADEEEVIDGIGERLVTVEGIDEKDASIFCEGCGRPKQ
jgi:hypothetical protein